jgi:hypothetical protein
MIKILLPVVVIAAAFSAVLFAVSDSKAAVNITTAQDAYDTPVGWPGYSDSDSRVLVGRTGGKVVTAGWRFENLEIPACTLITSASVTLVQREWGHEFETTFALEDIASPEPFTKMSTPSQRWANRTDSSVSWSWDKATPGTEIESPSLASMIQELVDTYGDIDSIVMLETPNASHAFTEYHEWESIESGQPAVLHVEYASGGGAGYGYGYGCTPPGAPQPLIGIYEVSNVIDISEKTTQTFVATCQTGDKATGGGYEITSPVSKNAYSIVKSASTGTGWAVTVTNHTGADIVGKVQAVCGDFTP